MEIVLAVLLTFLVTGFVCFLFFRAEGKRRSIQKEQQYQEQIEAIKLQKKDTDAILQIMDLGALFYDPSGALILSNRASEILLPQIPETFHQFLNQYGEVNSLSGRLMMGKDTADAIIENGARRVYLKVYAVDQMMGQSHAVLLRDVTRQFEEERQRKEYVSNVSHELRTPLTTIKTYSESLIDWGVNEKQREQILKDVRKIYDDSLRMEKLIEDLYLLSSVDENSIHRSMRVEPLDLPAVIRPLIDRMQVQAMEDRNIRLQFQVVGSVPKMYGDRAQIERIVTNLVSNAIKYGRENGSVQVYAGFLMDEIYLKVKDDGVGISEKDQEHIFERFYRVDDSRSRTQGGRGLGLAIVKELVGLNQGTISLKSALTHGSEFTVLFPSAQKVLLQTLDTLIISGRTSNSVQEVAATDLDELAQSMGIMSKWKNMNTQSRDELVKAISRLMATPQRLQKREEAEEMKAWKTRDDKN